LQFAIIFVFCTSTVYSQSAGETSKLFYSGKDWPTDIFLWIWGFSELPVEVPDMGYTPGTPAFRWGTELTWRDNQGLFFGYHNGLNLSSVWSQRSIHFKLRAPNGVSPGETLEIWLYDTRWIDWQYAIYHTLTDENYQQLNDGMWHSFAIPLDTLKINLNDIDRTKIAAVSFETSENTNSDLIYIDDVWIGSPRVNMKMTLFDGMALPQGVGSEVKGFADNNLMIAEGEGSAEGTNAIVWENNTTAGYNNAGIGFTFNTQDFSHQFNDKNDEASSVKIKIKAPAGINDLILVWRDQNNRTATKVIDNTWIPDTTWNGEWQKVEIPLYEFDLDSGFDSTDIYYFSVSPANAAIPERILIDDIWVGEPFINNMPPPAVDSIIVDSSIDNVNYISWANIPSEEGESYNLYRSSQPITDLSDEDVITLALGVPEGVDEWITFTHYIYHPYNSGNVTNYYAVESVDAAGRISETFKAFNEPVINEGAARGFINLNTPDFKADGDLGEWSSFIKYDVTYDTTVVTGDSSTIDTVITEKDIVLFHLLPDPGYYWGSINGPLDYSADVYAAMDNNNIYLAIDVTDDVFSYREENTQHWQEDEAIELFLGLYKLKFMHDAMQRGAEPDYRIVFRPDSMMLPDGSTIPNSSDNYYFEIPDDSTSYDSSYVIEAKLPFSSIQLEGDAEFTPGENMTIPFEVYATDADIPDGGAEGRLQLGDNMALNPWGDGPKVWGSAWIGRPMVTDLDDDFAIPYEFSLSQNYPNPFNPSTTINFTLAQTADVRMDIYNVLGEKVTTLVDSKEMNAGKHSVEWNGHDVSEKLAASGVYFYRLISGKMMQSKKMLLLR
jgi:hypothetical protein